MLHVFGPEQDWPDQDLIAFSEEFDAPLAVAAYHSGVFPMPLPQNDDAYMGWWSPRQRGVLPLDGVRVTRSLRKSAKHCTTTIDVDVAQVIDRCADPDRPGGWITEPVRQVYLQLAEAGVVHSIETWNEAGTLVGGLYGVSIGGLFAGESMFHDQQHGRDASKIALLRLVAEMSRETTSAQREQERLLDVQWQTPHLASLGAITIDRTRYFTLLDAALAAPAPQWRTGTDGRLPGWPIDLPTVPMSREEPHA